MRTGFKKEKELLGQKQLPESNKQLTQPVTIRITTSQREEISVNAWGIP